MTDYPDSASPDGLGGRVGQWRARQDSNLRPTAPEGYGNGGFAELIARRDGAVTAIDAAWQAVERGDPTALRQCVVAMSVARDVLAELEPLDASAPTSEVGHG